MVKENKKVSTKEGKIEVGRISMKIKNKRVEVKREVSKIGCLLIIFAIAGSLINTSTFGYLSLTPYFIFTITAFMAAGYFSLKRETSSFHSLPLSLTILIVLAGYIYLHGLVRDQLQLKHYYWLALGAFAWSIYLWQPVKHEKYLINTVVLLLGIIECAIVIFQYVHLVSSLNPYYRSTGSWQNPNVTATFIAFTIAILVEGNHRIFNKYIIRIIQVLSCLSILMLQSRTAFLISLLFIAEFCWRNNSFRTYINKLFSVRYKWLWLITGMTIVAFLIYLLAFGIKSDSSYGRMRICKNTLLLISQSPLFGSGFGLFEQAYNKFVAVHALPSVDYANMPYNDFMEITVEGGIVAFLLWGAFLGFLTKDLLLSKAPIFPVLALSIVQMLNFGFQGIPIMVMFLWHTESLLSKEKCYRCRLRWRQAFAYLIGSGSILLGVLQIHRACAYRELQLIMSSNNSDDMQHSLEGLDQDLSYSSLYHQSFGAWYIAQKDWNNALRELSTAENFSSNPIIWEQKGYIYSQTGKFDNAHYYYTLMHNLRPRHLQPLYLQMQLALLQKDTTTAIQYAKSIIAAPVIKTTMHSQEMQKEAKQLIDEMR